MRSSRRWLWIALIGACLALLSLAGGSADPSSYGSSFRRTPDGYAAWYAWMEEQGSPIQRWQKPMSELGGEQRVTLLQVQEVEGSAPQEQMDWVKSGHRLVILGRRMMATAAPFRSLHSSEQGSLTLETRRRFINPARDQQALLEDDFGVIVWQEQVGQGQVIYAVTPHLAANAYQRSEGNFAFLADLVTVGDQPIWVDEYIHGYRDPDASATATVDTWWAYLAATPWSLVLVQMVIVLGVAIVAANQRLGDPLPLTEPKLANNEAYIQSLAAVLLKAEATDFLVDLLGRAQRQTLQRSLGLGSEPVDHPTLLAAWAEQTGRPASELAEVLQWIPSGQRAGSPSFLQFRPRPRQIEVWLKQLASLTQQSR